jgi:hypothetical protein
MSPGRSLSRDSLTAKTTSANARKIKNLSYPMSELSNGTKKHTSKSRETIPLTTTAEDNFQDHCHPAIYHKQYCNIL